MRNALNGFYRLAGALSALQLTAIMVMVVLQVLGRVLDRLLVWVGADALGLNIPGLAELAAFLLLGATFFGLAYTFWQGGHIRVTLLLQRLPVSVQRYFDMAMVLVAIAITAFAAWYSAWLAYDSYDFGDLSIGMVPVPLWIPQLGMVLGLVWLLIALLDAFVSLVTGRLQTIPTEDPQE
ncbi:TRAP transporter small permease [Marinobacter nanhaiticus D15-8W]|uniref:TRAP transporter small permease protein n=1 Tax=Marinobacter nanhaiticus D15-8W TaxID=626887 RepID=N6VYG2_9GAMM|nr:TRAP transporter small permease [Marinobacter nanhaiticus]ENO12914.1 TRAP transporter small permease [Marinobacter nanhaiticus D15-8W]BES70265.1 TRAP transporter small permease [Marinobacter nanhaiticus D15-8W]